MSGIVRLPPSRSPRTAIPCVLTERSRPTRDPALRGRHDARVDLCEASLGTICDGRWPRSRSSQSSVTAGASHLSGMCSPMADSTSRPCLRSTPHPRTP